MRNWLSLSLWPSLHAYLTAKSLPASAKAVAEKFDVSLEEAHEAVEGLEKLGLLRIEDNRYEAKEMNFVLTKEELSSEKVLKHHIIKTKDMLSQMHGLNIRQGHTYTIATDEACMNSFIRGYKKLVDELYEKSKSVKEGGIYNISSSIIKTSSLDDEKGEK